MKSVFALLGLAVVVVFPQPHSSSIALVPVVQGGPIPPEPVDVCPVTNLEPGACQRPLVGCICLVEGVASIESMMDCEGCTYSFGGSINCSMGSRPPVTIPVSGCTGLVGCDLSGGCFADCPCNGNPFLVFGIDCGSCP